MFANGFIKFIVLLIIGSLSTTTTAKEVVELQALNFELAITSYQYLANLFYDHSDKGSSLEKVWQDAAASIENMCDDCEMSKIDSSDPELKEIIDAYMLTVPCIRVFRRGIMGEYRGPIPTSSTEEEDVISKGGRGRGVAEEIAAYIKEDSLPSVQIVKTLDEIKAKVKDSLSVSSGAAGRTVVLGFFNITEEEAAGKDESGAAEGYALDPWGQFQASADSLRGHASFYGVLPEKSLLESFKVDIAELPVLYLVAEAGDSLVPFPGEVLEAGVTEWVLRHSMPAMDELSFTRPSGELYATQFFSAKKLKFILFFPSSTTADAARASVLSQWKELSETFRSQALFSYMIGGAVPDVLEYFALEEKRDFPIIVAHDPARDYKYISTSKLSLASPLEIQHFVAGVLSGAVSRVLKSEPIPRPIKKTSSSSHVVKLVGNTVVEAVSRVDTDVFLVVYAPWCAHCKRLLPTVDILAKAVAAESRILIAKIDGTANDLPVSWNVKTYPTLLWFPARDKPYTSTNKNIQSSSSGGLVVPIPRPYWDAGQSLVELVSFLQRQGSFDSKTLRIATSEQLSSLLAEEDTLRAKYELEEINQRRNEGRVHYDDNEWLDYVLGEIVFDGKRWHIALLAVLVAIIIILVFFIILSSSFSNSGSVGSSTATNVGSAATGTALKKKKTT